MIRPLFHNVHSHQFFLLLKTYFRTLCSLSMYPVDDRVIWKDPGYFCPFKREALLDLAPCKVKVLFKASFHLVDITLVDITLSSSPSVHCPIICHGKLLSLLKEFLSLGPFLLLAAGFHRMH